MKRIIRLSLSMLFIVYCLLFTVFGQSPKVEKIDPPSWWVGSTINPVRVLVRGTNLKGATVTGEKGLITTNFKASNNGHYLFFDVRIPPLAKAGQYTFKLTNSAGSTDIPFEVMAKSSRVGRFQGYTTDDVIYFLMPDRFADGDPSNNDPEKSKGLYDRSKGRHYHGGDLQGVINKLEYLKSLGVTAIWTTPVYDNNDKFDTKEVYPGVPETTGYHGYGAIDMYGVDEHLGDMAKLQEFVQIAQKMGFKVIQDQVANHTGPYHVWADDPPTPTWWNGTLENHLSNNWQKWTAMNPRASYQTQKRNIEGWFIDILPDFNQNDPEVEKYLIQNSLWWLEMGGFDAIRMDTLPHVPRSFWQKWGTAIKKEYPKVNILGELFDADPALISYFQAGRKGHDGVDTKIDTLYDFGLFYPIRNSFAKGESIRGVSQMLAKDWLYPNPNILTTFIGVHDMPRFMNEKGATIEGLKMAQTFIMTTRGTPLLYYGDEIAMDGGADPDNRRDFPGGFAGDANNAFTEAGRSEQQNDVWSHLATLGELRKSNIALRNGKSIDLFDEDQQMAYARVSGTNFVIVAFNNDTKPATIEFSVTDLKLPDGTGLVDSLGEVVGLVVTDGKIKMELPARYGAILTAK